MQGGGEFISDHLALRSNLISGSCQERRDLGASTSVYVYKFYKRMRVRACMRFEYARMFMVRF